MRDLDWIKNARVYHIYLMGFSGAPRRNDGKLNHRLEKVYEWIPHIKSLGCNVIYFSPIFLSLSHGYDTTSFYELDNRLGTWEEFKTLTKVLHENGIKVILDAVLNHVGREFFAFKDIEKNKEKSKYLDWFVNIDFSKRSPKGDSFSYEPWKGHYSLVKLNHNNEDVVNHLLGAVKKWIIDFDIDGLRIDAADCIQKDFFAKLNSLTSSLKKDFWLMGELGGGYVDYLGDDLLDSLTNYEIWREIHSAHNNHNYYELFNVLEKEFGPCGIYKEVYLYNFLDNHDVNRIMSLLQDKKDIYNVYTVLYTIPGIPSIYYGSEFGIEAKLNPRGGRDYILRPCLNLNKLVKGDKTIIEHIKYLAHLRETKVALTKGSYEQVFVTNEQFVYARVYENQVILIALNCSNQTQEIRFNYRGIDYLIVVGPHSSKIIG